jgi:hypothetical protein
MRTWFIVLFLVVLPWYCFGQVPAFTSSNLPILLIETNGKFVVNEPKIMANLRIVDNGPGQRNQVAGPFSAYDGWVGIEYRGSSSQDLYAKKGYSIELRNADTTDRSVALLGMPKESDWVLIGPYNDKTLMRDVLALWMAAQVMDYAPRAHLVELMINQSYHGVYVLAEKIKRDDNRVAISKSDSLDITGGYIIKMDKYTGANNDGWRSLIAPTGAITQETDFLYHYPKPDEMSSAQKAYIKNWFDTYEAALNGPDYRDAQIGYRAYIATESFVDYLLVNEACRNVDAYRLSTFCYKDKDDIDGRLHMGPVWDFNIAFGLGDYCDGQKTTGWAFNHHLSCPEDAWLVPFWWKRLLTDAKFTKETLDRWKDLRAQTLSNSSINHTIDSLRSLLQESQARNFVKWPVLGNYVWPNAFVGNTYQQEVDYLKQWLTQRLTWMDGELNQVALESEYNPLDVFAPRVYPNPVYGQTLTTEVYLKSGINVKIVIHHADGRIQNEQTQICTSSGAQTLIWHAPLVGGMYFYTLYVQGEKQQIGKLVVH